MVDASAGAAHAASAPGSVPSAADEKKVLQRRSLSSSSSSSDEDKNKRRRPVKRRSGSPDKKRNTSKGKKKARSGSSSGSSSSSGSGSSSSSSSSSGSRSRSRSKARRRRSRSSSSSSSSSRASRRTPEQSVAKRKVYVARLSQNVTKEALKDIFSTYGKVISIDIPPDRQNPVLHRTFAYVEMESAEASKEAIEGLNNGVIDGKVVSVSEMDENLAGRRPSPRRGGAFRGGNRPRSPPRRRTPPRKNRSRSRSRHRSPVREQRRNPPNRYNRRGKTDSSSE